MTIKIAKQQQHKLHEKNSNRRAKTEKPPKNKEEYMTVKKDYVEVHFKLQTTYRNASFHRVEKQLQRQQNINKIRFSLN